MEQNKVNECSAHVPTETEEITMTCHKLAIKCGNFAILVDFCIMPQDHSQDTRWFSHQRREEVCMLLRGTVESRVEQYLEARKWRGQGKQQLEYAPDTPLSLEGDGFYITAYFVKRWDRLQCIARHQDRELRVFPDRFVICVTRLESSSPLCIREYVAPSEEDENQESQREQTSAQQGHRGSISWLAALRQGVGRMLLQLLPTLCLKQDVGVQNNQRIAQIQLRAAWGFLFQNWTMMWIGDSREEIAASTNLVLRPG